VNSNSALSWDLKPVFKLAFTVRKCPILQFITLCVFSGKCLNVIVFANQRRIYGQQETQVEVFAAGSDLALDPAYVRSWLDLLGRTPRVAPFLGKNAPIITALHKVLWLVAMYSRSIILPALIFSIRCLILARAIKLQMWN